MPSSLLQELDGVLQEPIGILELRAVPGIGIDQQLGVRNVLGQVQGLIEAIMMSFTPFRTSVG